MPEKLCVKFTRFAGGLVVVTRVSTLVVGSGSGWIRSWRNREFAE
jgi:hypothetical protein